MCCSVALSLHASTISLQTRLFGVWVTLGIAVISALSYRHNRNKYATDKKPSSTSVRQFRFVYRFIQVSTIISSLGGCLYFDWRFLDLHDSVILLYSGALIAAVGTCLFLVAKTQLGDRYSPCFDAYVPNEFTASGLYRYVRHPIYASNLLVMLGAFVMSGSTWILLNWVLLAYYYRRAAYKEEIELSAIFPQYRTYQSQTGRFFPKPFRRIDYCGDIAIGVIRSRHLTARRRSKGVINPLWKKDD
jgi:protein-S-isoprenylcysteine O-methyltransferase Ste14